MDYSEKLKDPRWQKKRLQILSRDDWHCQICFGSKITLNVHHLIYFPNKEPWECPDKLLTTLCEVCHEHETKDILAALDRLKKAARSCLFTPWILELSEALENCSIQDFWDPQISAFCWALSDDKARHLVLDAYFKSLKSKEESALV